MDMDVDEPGDGKIISHAISFSAVMGMGLLAKINASGQMYVFHYYPITSRG